MDNNKNVDITKHEKNKLHMKYIIAISAIISLGSIVLSLYSQDAFVAQISFAATITSIVLSVIAIWMSISGERTTSDIRVKIAESTERLSGTTKEIEAFNNNYKEAMDTQLAELKNVQEQLAQIIQSVNVVKEQVSFMSEKNTINPNIINNSVMTTTQRVELFKSIFMWITCRDYHRECLFCHMVQITNDNRRKSIPITLNQIITYLPPSLTSYDWMGILHTYWGIINTLLAATVFDDPNAETQIINFINNKLYQQSPNPIN